MYAVLTTPSPPNPTPLPSSRSGNAVIAESTTAPAIPLHTLNDGYYDVDPLSSMKMLTKEGPNGLPKEIRCFPALIFQVLAITLQFISGPYEAEIDELRFGPSQTVVELSKEYSDCGVYLSNMVGNAKLTLIGVQHSSMRDWWLLNAGDLMNAWMHSRQTVRYDSMLTLPC
jgi:hypothetical protein